MDIGIVDYYLKTFVPLYEELSDNYIDISSLLEFGIGCSPVRLDYKNKEESKKYV